MTRHSLRIATVCTALLLAATAEASGPYRCDSAANIKRTRAAALALKPSYLIAGPGVDTMVPRMMEIGERRGWSFDQVMKLAEMPQAGQLPGEEKMMADLKKREAELKEEWKSIFRARFALEEANAGNTEQCALDVRMFAYLQARDDNQVAVVNQTLKWLEQVDKQEAANLLQAAAAAQPAQ